MIDSLRHLLQHSLDYAGMFPPASLPVEQAVAAFLHERNGPSGWFLSRLVCPANKLVELAEALPPAAPPAAAVVSSVARPGRTTGEFLANLDGDLSAIAAFRARTAGGARLDAVELRIPGDAVAPAALKKLLVAIDALLARVPENGLRPFCELPSTPDLPAQLAVVAEHNAGAAPRRERPFGFKLRTGGTESATFPSAAQLAQAIHAARVAGLAMKCTGGLHHALPHRSATMGVAMHGFVNVFAAAALARTAGLASSDLERILDETSAPAFAFADDAMVWRGLRVSADELAATRREFLVAFGCCYVDRPLVDLRRAGWLPPVAAA